MLVLVGALVAAGAALGSDRVHNAVDAIVNSENPQTDSDQDGLPDAVERSGITTAAGDTYVTDPKLPDSDGDGLADSEEIGALTRVGDTAPVYQGFADPGLADTDEDGVSDGDEYFLGTDPRSTDSDGDGLGDAEELDFGSDPLVDNPDGDAYSDREEQERGSPPMTYDKSGWQARLSTSLTALGVALSLADKVVGGGKLRAVSKAVLIAKAASVAAPMIWHVVTNRNWSDFDAEELLDAAFGDDMDKLGEILEGGHSDYVAYVGRRPSGSIAYVGITNDFNELTADHGGPNTLTVVGGSEPVPLGQARAMAEAVISGEQDSSIDTELANTRHVLDPWDNLYAPAMRWGPEQLDRTGFDE